MTRWHEKRLAKLKASKIPKTQVTAEKKEETKPKPKRTTKKVISQPKPKQVELP